jgi:hypothetical protein
MAKSIKRNQELLNKAQNIINIAENVTSTSPTVKKNLPEVADITPTAEQVEDICTYFHTCEDHWKNKDWNEVCTESDSEEFNNIILPFCQDNPDFVGCDDCLL